jgi:hypothetical protein
MPSITTKKLGYNTAKSLRNTLYNSGNTDPVLYTIIGNHVPYANESSPDSIVDTISAEKTVWDNMYAGKRLTANDIELVVPKVSWSGNTKYRQYDDTIDYSTLLTANTTQNLKPMYVITTGRNVYKCISNNTSANSTIEPTGDYTTSNGNIATADGFIWKYMYNIKPSNKFLTTDWVPAPISTNQLDYNVSDTNVIDGELASIIVTNAGSNYFNSIVTVSAFATGCSTLQLANTTKVSANMSVTGTGIYSGTYIASVDTLNSKITLSTPVTANGGGTSNNLTISTRVYIDGDGTGTIATAALSSGNNVSNITVSTIGLGYSYANVYIYGSGTSANARAIIPPKYGHAYNPAQELGGSNIMVATRIGEIDSTEGGLISSNTTFRQYGLLINPHKYGNTSPVTYSTANSVISQTTNINLVAGTDYALDEIVYQGSSVSNAAFIGYVNAQSSNQLKLSKVKGTITVGSVLIGATSGTSRTVVSKINPEFQPYSGDIVHIENITKTQRAEGQAENIKFVVRF